MDFEEIIRRYATDGGDIPAGQTGALIEALKTAVGNGFVDKARYRAKLDELEDYKQKALAAQDGASSAEKWKTKYDALKDDFEAFKTEQTKKETRAAKEKAYRELLRQAGVSEKRLDAVMKVSDIDGLELDGDGKAKDSDRLVENVKAEWSDFIETAVATGAPTPTPPAGNHAGTGTLTKDEIFKIKDASQRQNAIKENIQLFRKGV